MPDQPIFVDNTPFFGRVEEQKQFIAALQDVLNQPASETLPYIFLLYGDGGIGKTTLAKRFRDIVAERPFRGKFQLLWIDWEDERRRYASLQVGRENISPEVVFDVIHAVAVRQQWGTHFEKYQKAIKVRAEAEKKAAEAVTAADERSELSALRSAGASTLAKLVRTQIPVVGESGEKLVQAFLDAGIKIGAEEAAKLRGALETRLRAKLKPDQFAVFLNPNEQLALTLADGLKQIAAAQPLIVVLDTYEIVDRPDVWLRIVARAAGPRVLWIISGRDDLVNNRLYGKDYFKGYPDDFPRRLYPYDMHQLATEDIQKYFAACAAGRSLTPDDAEAISRATRGIPLAIRQAADIWQRGTPLGDLVGGTTDCTPRAEIVQKMTERYLLHVIVEADKQAIYALALARGDVEILRAMLRPDGIAVFDLDALLHRLERDYASVHAEKARLHKAPADFFLAYLRAGVRRTEDRVKILNQRAVEALRSRLSKLEADLPLIENRYANEDWAKAALDLAYYLFWLDENEAWHWFIPRFVESLAYSRDLQRGLIHIADDWKDQLSTTDRKRLNVLLLNDEAHMITELEELAAYGWLKDDGEAERRAILDPRHGRLLYSQKKHAEALAYYDRAEQGLPDTGEDLKKQLGEALYDLSQELTWPEDRDDAIYSPEAERIVPTVVSWLPEKQDAWYQLGVTLNLAGKNEESIAAYQRAIDLDPKDAYPHHGLGRVYISLSRTDEAIAEYQRAIELDLKNALPHNGLGVVYQSIGQLEKAREEDAKAVDLAPQDGSYCSSLVGILKKLRLESEAAEHEKIARELIAKENEYARACFEAICGNVDEVLALLKVALETKQTSLAWARRDPDFDNIRDDPRFKVLVGETD